MLRVGIRQAFGEFQPGQVITICDHLQFLPGIKLENEILRETFGVAFHALIEAAGFWLLLAQLECEDYLGWILFPADFQVDCHVSLSSSDVVFHLPDGSEDGALDARSESRAVEGDVQCLFSSLFCSHSMMFGFVAWRDKHKALAAC